MASPLEKQWKYPREVEMGSGLPVKQIENDF